MGYTNNYFSNKLLFRSCTALFSAVLIAFTFSTNTHAQDLDVPYVPTPQNVVERMLDLAQVESGDYVIDLGSGDGRIVISAAKRGAVGHGIDLDPQRIREARQNARDAGVTDRVIFLQQDLFKSDFSRASVITMYLLTSVNRKLRPHLLEDLEPGTRVVSHSFNMGDWQPDRKESVGTSTRSHDIYLWIIPANAKGNWTWDTEGITFDLSVSQQYQEISPDLQMNGRPVEVSNALLKGKRISFRAGQGDLFYTFNGKIEGDQITGMVQIHDGDNDTIHHWSATRN